MVPAVTSEAVTGNKECTVAKVASVIHADHNWLLMVR
mgnify:CR=1 FL=1